MPPLRESASSRILWITFAMAIAITPATAQQPAPLDHNLYTTYSFEDGRYQNLMWQLCGTLGAANGCFTGGSLGPFGQVCAMMEGSPIVDTATGTVEHPVYIIDSAAGSGSAVTLFVYAENVDGDNTTIKLRATVSLPLVGGSSAICSMAANEAFLFIGTNQGPYAVRVQKNNFTIRRTPVYSRSSNVTSITSDRYGYVTVTSFDLRYGDYGSLQFGPNGQSSGFDPAPLFMLNTYVATTIASFPTTDIFASDSTVPHAAPDVPKE